MKQAAEAKGLDGWLITLEFPSYYAVMTYADDRALREEVYAAYCTRASDQGPNAGQNDNGPLMPKSSTCARNWRACSASPTTAS
ncbi:oligopeptidase A [Ectopseudomonas oleovorans]|uniref:Oligopeptidase A n=1 Tax=Ectopseudomonas oleovorans TaxID=301 RepID=A0A379K144_ECTOL|nr:oligopeptidase A [Pseudomonas oleovorans]